MDIHVLLDLAFHMGASDIHLTVNSAPAFRIHGKLLPFDSLEWKGTLNTEDKYMVKLAETDTERFAQQLLSPERYEQFHNVGEIDFSYTLENVGRFRVNAYLQQGTIALAIRLINSKILSFHELGLPDVLGYLARRPKGIVLVTGPTGCGKSTSLASMIDLINKESHQHIITLEDPIEFIHEHNKCLINQREIGRDSKTFASALRSAMREDPDVILVGEMRDTETIGIALTAAETGHLVFATLHTSSAAQTVDRIIDVFPPYQQAQIRVQLANTLQGVVAQQLIGRVDKPGVVAALEVMIATPAIRNLIREGKTYQIISQIQTGTKFGMTALDTSLKILYQRGTICRDEAINRAVDPDSLKKTLL